MKTETIQQVTLDFPAWAMQVRQHAWPHYHVALSDVEGEERVKIFTGTNLRAYSCFVSGADYTAWLAEFTGSVEQTTERDVMHLLSSSGGTPKMLVTDDGREVNVPYPASYNKSPWFTCHSDGLVEGVLTRGGGARIKLTWAHGEDGAEGSNPTKTTTIQFHEPVEVHDAAVVTWPAGLRSDSTWHPDDTISVKAVLPATEVAEDGTLDVFAVDVGTLQGLDPLGYSLYIPSGHPVLALLGGPPMSHRLTNAVPVWAENNDGFWSLDRDSGVVTPCLHGQGNVNLLNIPIEVGLIHSMPLGQGDGEMDFENYRSEYVHQTWHLELSITKVGVPIPEGGPVHAVSGWILVYRDNVTL